MAYHLSAWYFIHHSLSSMCFQFILGHLYKPVSIPEIDISWVYISVSVQDTDNIQGIYKVYTD